MKTSSSSSAAALTESFDYDLHLETEKPTGFFSRWRLSQFYGVILFVTLTLSFSYYRHTSPHRSVEPPPVDDIISKEKEQETLFKIRLKVTEDLNEQVKSRISLLNESIASLRSRVYEIERKPVMTTSVNFTATKIIIDNNVKSLSDRLHNQSLVLNNLEEMQKITKSDIDKLRAESDEKDTKYSFYAADITERLTRIHTSLDTIQTKREQLLFNLSVTNESKLKSRNMILLGKITKLEEKFSSAIETAGAFTNKMLHTKVEQVDDNGNVKHSSNQVEVVVRNVWSENMEIYQKLIPVPECPKMIIPPPKIIEIIKYAEVVIPVEPPPLSVDYARGHSGAEIVHEETSVTYTPPEIDFKHFSTNILNYLGIDRNSELGDSFIISYLTKIIDIIVPNIIHILGIDNSAGRPEDAISSDMSLGSCWPVQGSKGKVTIKLSKMINIESISIDHISRNDAIDLRSAPKDFKVFGSSDLSEEMSDYNYLGRGSYNISSNYISSQNFPMKKNPEPCQYVSLQILTNHGNPEYTCLYRVRVHGEQIDE